jgi:hypothetical protein
MQKESRQVCVTTNRKLLTFQSDYTIVDIDDNIYNIQTNQLSRKNIQFIIIRQLLRRLVAITTDIIILYIIYILV